MRSIGIQKNASDATLSTQHATLDLKHLRVVGGYSVWWAFGRATHGLSVKNIAAGKYWSLPCSDTRVRFEVYRDSGPGSRKRRAARPHSRASPSPWSSESRGAGVSDRLRLHAVFTALSVEQHAGKVLTHKFLLGELWDELVDAQYLRVYVRQLRQKIEADPERPQYVLTETGVGYRLRAPD